MEKKYYQNLWKSTLPADFDQMRTFDGDLMIGTQLPDTFPEYRFEGNIDKFKLYNQVLTESEVLVHYSNPWFVKEGAMYIDIRTDRSNRWIYCSLPKLPYCIFNGANEKESVTISI